MTTLKSTADRLRELAMGTVEITDRDNYFDGAYYLADEIKPALLACAELVKAAGPMAGWLKRMSELKWKDKNYAPNFKKSHQDLEKALSALDAVLKKGE